MLVLILPYIFTLPYFILPFYGLFYVVPINIPAIFICICEVYDGESYIRYRVNV